MISTTPRHHCDATQGKADDIQHICRKKLRFMEAHPPENAKIAMCSYPFYHPWMLRYCTQFLIMSVDPKVHRRYSRKPIFQAKFLRHISGISIWDHPWGLGQQPGNLWWPAEGYSRWPTRANLKPKAARLDPARAVFRPWWLTGDQSQQLRSTSSRSKLDKIFMIIW